MLKLLLAIVGPVGAIAVAGCGSHLGSAELTTGSIATISTPAAPEGVPESVPGTTIVQGQRARVFTLAGLGTDCSSTAQPRMMIDKVPAKGSVTFDPVAPTVVQYSLSGRCIGHRVASTGVYYTPRPGEAGPDTFTVSAHAGSATVATRKIDVKIAD
jgi:hypothetical protein